MIFPTTIADDSVEEFFLKRVNSTLSFRACLFSLLVCFCLFIFLLFIHFFVSIPSYLFSPLFGFLLSM